MKVGHRQDFNTKNPESRSSGFFFDFKRKRMFKQSDIDNLVKNQGNISTGNIFNQTMIRIKDPIKSLHFYLNHLGFSLLVQKDFPDMKFSLFFLTTLFENEVVPTDSEELKHWMSNQRTILELTYNYDTELDQAQAYHNGNTEPRGFGHLGVSVPDFEKACADFESAGIEFIKRPQDGKMPNIAFIKDPDGYWIEIFAQHAVI